MYLSVTDFQVVFECFQCCETASISALHLNWSNEIKQTWKKVLGILSNSSPLLLFCCKKIYTCLTKTHAPYIAIFELDCPFDHRMMPWKYCDDISNSSGVIVLTDKQTFKHTNGQCWKRSHPRCVGGNYHHSWNFVTSFKKAQLCKTGHSRWITTLHDE